jgi:ABC-2 type transport system permease protein
MMAATAAWAASLGLLIGAIARKEQQVVAYSLAAMFLFAVLGGAWFPLEVAGRGFARVGGVLPSAWAMVGFQNIVLRGLGSHSALLPAGIIVAWAAAFFGIATWRFRFE